jgi:hypothetical protein
MHSDAEVSQVGLVLEGFFSISKVRRSQFSHRLSPGLSRRRPEAFNIWMVLAMTANLLAFLVQQESLLYAIKLRTRFAALLQFQA